MLFFINVKQSKFHLKTLFILMFMLFSNKSKCQVLQNDEKDIFDSVLISYFDHYAYVKMNYNIDTIYLVKISYFTNKFMCYDWKYDSIYDVVHDVVQTFVINNEKVIIEKKQDIIGDFPQICLIAYKKGYCIYYERISFSNGKVFHPKLLMLEEKLKKYFTPPHKNCP